jgi:hypothetical protein
VLQKVSLIELIVCSEIRIKWKELAQDERAKYTVLYEIKKKQSESEKIEHCKSLDEGV